MTAYNYNRIARPSRNNISEVTIRSWWVVAFIILNALIFNIAFKQLNHKKILLLSTIERLEEAKYIQACKNHDYTFKINSLDDPRSVELVLRQELGLISEGQTKVHFIQTD